MASITITIPDNIAPDVLDAFAYVYNYSPNSGLTKSQFTKQKIIEQIKTTYKNWKFSTQSQTLSQTVQNESNNLDIT